MSYGNRVIAFSFVTSASYNFWKKMRYTINGWMSGPQLSKHMALELVGQVLPFFHLVS